MGPVWRRRLARAALAALIALLLLLMIGPLRVRVVEQEALGSPPHEVVQVPVPDDKLMEAMHETYDLLREEGADRDEFIFYSRNLLAGYTAGNAEEARKVRKQLIAMYPDPR